jgi:hypothetical protein
LFGARGKFGSEAAKNYPGGRQQHGPLGFDVCFVKLAKMGMRTQPFNPSNKWKLAEQPLTLGASCGIKLNIENN